MLEFRWVWDRIKPIIWNKVDKCSEHNPKIGPLTDCRNFFWDHFPKELRHQAQLGNQAFWGFVNKFTLTSPDWLKCDWRGTGKGTFLSLGREKINGKLSVNLFFFCNFRGKEYYLISLRSVQIRIFCLWLKYAFFVNSKRYLRSNGTKGNFKPRKYLLLESVLQALVSVTCFSEGLARLQHKCTSSSTGLENIFNVKKIPASKQH